MVRSNQHPTSSGSSTYSLSSILRRSTGSANGIPKRCFCGLDPVIRTSFTDDNLGRRFYGCRNYKDGGHHLMKWWDEAMLEEFNDVKLYVDQHGQLIDGIFVSEARNGNMLSTVLDDVKIMKAEIAQLKNEMEKPFVQIQRGVEWRSLLYGGAIITVLIIWVCVGLK